MAALAQPIHTMATPSDAALIERLQTLRAILPGMAQDVARARREAARLRCENAALRRRLADLEARDADVAVAS
jgi:regulator of replication initiation timing